MILSCRVRWRLGQFRRGDVLEPAASEFGRFLERDAVLVAVRVDTGQIRVAPWRPCGLPVLEHLCRERPRGFLLLEALGDVTDELPFLFLDLFRVARGRLRLAGDRHGRERHDCPHHDDRAERGEKSVHHAESP